MFKEIKLKKNGWHAKLQMWTFGWTHEYELPFRYSFCPYFWLTIFCIMIIPFTLIYKGLKYTCIGLAMLWLALIEFIDVCICAPLFKLSIKLLPLEDLSELVAYEEKRNDRYRYQDYDKKKEERLKAWIELNNDESGEKRKALREQWMIEYRARNEKERIKRVAKEKLESERYMAKLAREAAKPKKPSKPAKNYKKIFFNAIVKYTKYLIPVFITLVCSAILVGLYKVLAWIVSLNLVVNWGFLLTVLKVVGFAVLVVGVCATGYYLLKKCNLTWIRCPKWLYAFAEATGELVVRNADRCSLVVSKFGDLIKGVCSFIADFVKAYKEENCPNIEWEE